MSQTTEPRQLHHTAIPLGIALAVLMLAVVWILGKVQVGTFGRNLYALDDAYIHMAMARNLAQHGVWGVTPDAFSGSSSSMLWTLLLAGLFRLFGPVVWLPLALNVLCAAGIVIAVDRLLPAWEGRGGLIIRTGALLSVALLVPLPTLVFFGMENTLHALLMIGLCFVAARELQSPPGRAVNVGLLVLAGLCVMARLESLFMLAGIAALFGLQRRGRSAVLVLVAGALPVVAYGLVSTHQGWQWLPNSVLVKGNVPQTDLLHYALSLAGRVYGQIFSQPALFALILAALLLLGVSARRDEARLRLWKTMLALTLWSLLLHLMFARFDAGRYEAYLMALLLTGTLGALIELRAARPELSWAVTGRRWPALVVVALLLAPMAVRAARLIRAVPPTVASVYRQQVQMGDFVARYWGDATVVLNDIGAVNYLAPRVRCVDFAGLASMPAAEWMLSRTYTPQKLESLAAGQRADLAIVYDSWLRRLTGGIPSGWVKLEDWTNVSSVSPDHNTVAIYAVRAGAAAQLRRDLAAFRPSLPAGVSVKIAEQRTP